jgi:hypothetical protein
MQTGLKAGVSPCAGPCKSPLPRGRAYTYMETPHVVTYDAKDPPVAGRSHPCSQREQHHRGMQSPSGGRASHRNSRASRPSSSCKSPPVAGASPGPAKSILGHRSQSTWPTRPRPGPPVFCAWLSADGTGAIPASRGSWRCAGLLWMVKKLRVVDSVACVKSQKNRVVT